jgi:hypothetical protein
MNKPRERSPRVSRKISTKGRVFAIIGIVALATVFVLSVQNKADLRVPTEQSSCNNYCQTKFGTNGYLQKLHETLSSDRDRMSENLNSGREKLIGNLSAGHSSQYTGPWRCICQTE